MRRGLTPKPARIPLYSTVESALSDHPLDTTEMNADPLVPVSAIGAVPLRFGHDILSQPWALECRSRALPEGGVKHRAQPALQGFFLLLDKTR